MNPTTFDALARSFASRRGVLVGGLAILPALVMEGHEAAAAKCKPAGAKCGGQKKCCNGARCRRGRCRCKSNSPLWAGECCKNRFALASGLGLDPIPGTEFCCPATGVCSKDGDPAHDDCCQENETCIDGKCCCDGCRGTVICGGVCCGSASCCNGACCPIGQICAETEDGPDCVVGQQVCNIDDDCDPGETCWDGTCCTADRMCVVTVGNDPNVQVCCKASEYCDQALGTCCSNGNICTTGKKVRIRV
jgi:hypothetical protein